MNPSNILSITNTQILSNQNQGALDQVILRSDFQFWIAVTLGLCALGLWLANEIFLRRYKITREQLQSERPFSILKGRRKLAAFKLPRWTITSISLLLKVGLPLLIYGLVTAAYVWKILTGLGITSLLFVVNFALLFSVVFNSKSVFHRKNLFYKKDPSFIRIRLLFELGRRFIYFALALSFISYSIGRLDNKAFAGVTTDVPSFLLHVKYNLAGMTSLGSSPIVSVGNVSICFEIFRTIFAFGFLLLFVNTIWVGINSASPPATTMIKNEILGKKIKEAKLESKEDVRALIETIIGHFLKIPASQITDEADIVTDLGADSLEVAELQFFLEELFETGEIPETEILSKRTVGDVVQLFTEKAKIQTKFLPDLKQSKENSVV